MDIDGVTPEQFAQSTRNFLRYFEAIEQQTEMTRPEILESALSAIVTVMAADLGSETAADLLQGVVDRLRDGRPMMQ